MLIALPLTFRPQALDTYGSDAEMTSLLNQMDVYVLPLFNIDGYEYTHTSVSCSFEQLPMLTPSAVDLLHACVTCLLLSTSGEL